MNWNDTSDLRATSPYQQETTARTQSLVRPLTPSCSLTSGTWLTSNLLASAVYRFRLFEGLPMTCSDLPEVDIRVDFENLYISLEQQGLSTDIPRIVKAITDSTANLGSRYDLAVYADWQLLSKRAGRDLKAELDQLEVTTCNVVSQRGKNSSDMKIADDVRTLIEQDAIWPGWRRTIVLVTGDSDFCTLVNTTRERGHRVIIISLHSCLSRALARAADEVRYLDEEFKLRITPTAEIPRYAAVTMRILIQLDQRNRKWTYIDKLTLSSAENEQLRQAILAGIFICSEQRVPGINQIQHNAATLAPNDKHPLVKALRHFIEWLPDRITYCLHQRHMPYVDTNFLARGMALDYLFRQLGVGQNRHDAEEWLNLAASTGIIAKKRQPHPDSPTKIIYTWWPLGEVNSLNTAHSTCLQQICPTTITQETRGFDAPASGRVMNGANDLSRSSSSDVPSRRTYFGAFRGSFAPIPISSAG